MPATCIMNLLTVQAQCQDYPGCNYYTFDGENELCLLFSDCPGLSEQECNGCSTSEAGCLASNGTEAKSQLLMVFGGRLDFYYEDNFDDEEVDNILRNVSLISLDGGPEVPYCLKDLNQFPKQLSRSCSASLGNGELTIY